MRYTTYICLLLLLCSARVAMSFSGATDEDPQPSGHELFTHALQRHVESGRVDYEGMAEDREFKNYLKWLQKMDPASLTSTDAELAFWTNAYNALAIKGVLDNSERHLLSRRTTMQKGKELAAEVQRKRHGEQPPAYRLINSVLEVDGFFDKQEHGVAGKKYTLDQIEKEILLPKFKDPRLHFILVCAALSCPGLPSEAYTEATMQAKIVAVARLFLRNPEKNRLDRENKILYLSQIFNWYRDDFESGGHTLVEFVQPYLDPAARRFLAENEVKIEFVEYDWRLNRQ
ncbi:MAG: DUF547 domain-containing protein [bacterium]